MALEVTKQVEQLSAVIAQLKKAGPREADGRLTRGEMHKLLELAALDGFTAGECELLNRVYTEGLDPSRIVTRATPELGEDAFYLDGDARALIDSYFMEHDLPFGSNVVPAC
jgi:hypothetical protein